jgi:hypothetical protein
MKPHLMLNGKTYPIQWTERPTGALVGAGSLWTMVFLIQLLFQVAERGQRHVEASAQPQAGHHLKHCQMLFSVF